jgi:hypothetical protein
MLTFLLILAIVFIAVDLFVKLVIDPLASKQNKKHQEKIEPITVDPFAGLVGVTLYDGGELKDEKTEDKKIPENHTNEKPEETK